MLASHPMVAIARAAPSDAPGIARVYVDSWRHAYAGLLPDRVLVGLDYERHSREWAWVVANRGDVQPVFTARAAKGRIVGMASVGLSRAKDRPADGPYASSTLTAPVGEIFTLYVDPDWQDRGVGRGLLAAGLGNLAARGCRRAFLWVLRENPACFFYERMSGVRIAQRRERLWGCDVDEVAYGWTDTAAVAAKLGSCSAA